MKTLIAQQSICGELIASTATYNKSNLINFLVHKHHKNPEKIPQKLKTTHTYCFISQRSYQNISPVNQQKHLLIILLNGSKNFISRKNRLCRNGETRMEIQDQ